LAKIKDLKNKLDDKEHDNTLIEETSKKYKSEIDKLKSEYEKNIAEINLKHEQEIKDIKEKHKIELEQLQNQLEAKFQFEMNTVTNKHESIVKSLKVSLVSKDEQISELKKELEKISTELNERKNAMNDVDQRIADMQKKK
jgi:predicted nuclease with TOPRIM domain